ncbi:hypothetical protein [Candidatus Palauibacter sp.]|uniref:hypothetical protein n=1 Tax=Candidatus Palauibacter sp. TaxID=3101350 RepID=UPI003B5C804F
MSDNQRLPSSLYCDLFYGNPGAAEFRRDHVRVWLQVALFERGRSTQLDLANRFRTAYPGTAVTDEQLEDALASLGGEGLVEYGGSVAVLSEEGTRSVDEAKSRFHRSREQFLGAVVAHLRQTAVDPLSDEEQQAVRECSEEIVVQVLLAERQALEVLYQQVTDFEFVRDQTRERASELELCLQHRLPGILRTRALELARETRRGIGKASDDGRTYLHTLNRSVLSSFFLIRDPHHVEQIRKQATQRTYYLDTNIYLAWLYESQPQHDIVEPLLRALSAHGARLRILPQTVEEIRRIEDQVRRTVPRARGDKSLADYLVRERKVIFTDFWWAKRKDPNLTFGTWEFLHMDPTRTLSRLRVEVRAVEFEPNEDFSSLIPTFRNAIRGVKQDRGRVVRDEALTHDAEALVALAKLQLRGDRDEWGSAVQFLSLDGTLSGAVEECRNIHQRRFEKPVHPTALARLYLPGTTKELAQEEYETFVVGSIRESLGVLAEVSGYSHIMLIERLDQAGIPTATLLQAPRELLEPALAQLQGRSDLNKKLDQALRKRPEDRTPLIAEIQRDLEEAVSVGSELLREAEEKLEHETAHARSLDKQVASLREDLKSVQAVVTNQANELSATRSQVRRFKSALLLVVGIVVLVTIGVWIA